MTKVIDDPLRPCCHWTSGGILRVLGQNSLGLYVISELVDTVVDAVCWGSSPPADGLGATTGCDEGTSIGGRYKGLLLHLAGGDDDTKTALWAGSNVLLICAVATYFELAGIMIKL